MTVGLRFTSADLETLPDIPGVRYEIIDGDLYVSRQPQLAHQYTCGEICFALQEWSKRSGAGFAYATPGLVFAEDDEVIPDVVWISKARLLEAEDEQGHLHLAPELVVEVLSPGRANELRDREIKLSLYARQGVQEYWIADWQEKRIDVYRQGAAGLELDRTVSGDSALTSPLLPGFGCLVAGLWAPTIS